MFAIFKRELKNYFISPIGYVLLAIFFAFTGIIFFMNNIMMNTSEIAGVFDSIMSMLLMVFVPILTMKLMSDEKRQKTDQLLLTSPVSPTGVVLGKFFSAFAFYAIALCITIIYALILSVYGEPSFSSFVGNFVATLFVGGALISIGLFLSSLTESQMIAGISTFAVILAVIILGDIGSSLTNPVFAAIANFFAIFQRANEFLFGVFNISTIIYYISIVAIFIFLTIRVVEKKRWS